MNSWKTINTDIGNLEASVTPEHLRLRTTLDLNRTVPTIPVKVREIDYQVTVAFDRNLLLTSDHICRLDGKGVSDAARKVILASALMAAQSYIGSEGANVFDVARQSQLMSEISELDRQIGALQAQKSAKVGELEAIEDKLTAPAPLSDNGGNGELIGYLDVVTGEISAQP